MEKEYPYLSDVEKEKVMRFVEDEVMREAVRKVLLAPIYEQGTLKAGKAADPTQNGALALAFGRTTSAEELGIDLKTFAQAVYHVQDAFTQLSKIKLSTEKAPKRLANPAK